MRPWDEIPNPERELAELQLRDKMPPKNRQWIDFTEGELVLIKGQQFILTKVDTANSSLTFQSKVYATGKEDLAEKLRRIQAQGGL
jgi:hypothetical protein